MHQLHCTSNGRNSDAMGIHDGHSSEGDHLQEEFKLEVSRFCIEFIYGRSLNALIQSAEYYSSLCTCLAGHMCQLEIHVEIAYAEIHG